MKSKIFSTIIALLICAGLCAQAPQKFSYQAVVYNASNQLVVNAFVSLKIAICKGSPESAPVYVETHKSTTNANGLATIEIGGGTAVVAGNRVAFSAIDWSTGVYYIRTKIDPTGGVNYDLITLNTQLLSVPYALYAEKSGTGIKVDKGDKGDAGAVGPKGDAGSKIITGVGNPKFTRLGVKGDYFLDTVAKTLYGPKSLNAWPAGISLQGDGAFKNGTNPGDMYYWNGSKWQLLSSGAEESVLIISQGKPVWALPILGKVNIDSISTITNSGAFIEAQVTSNGVTEITARGLCWSTTPNPIIANTNTSVNGSGKGTFSASISGLAPGTIYYVRPYASNIAGTAYGTEMTFTTNCEVGKVNIVSISTITNNDAFIEAQVTSGGGAEITARGLCWSTTPNPIKANTNTSVNGSGKGTFSASISGLTRSTTYYVRPYATNIAGTAYGTEMTFTTNWEFGEVHIDSISNITRTGAFIEVQVTSNGGTEITARGLCWGTSPNPTINRYGRKTSVNGSGTGTFSVTISEGGGTYDVRNVTYYVRPYVTNSAGTAYGTEMSFKTMYYGVYEYGPAGGYIFYDKGFYSDGWRFIEIAQRDLTNSMKWSYGTKEEIAALPNSMDQGIGSGKANTLFIVANSDSYTAAKACLDYICFRGYDDWYLPSLDEGAEISRVLMKFDAGDFYHSGYANPDYGNPYLTSNLVYRHPDSSLPDRYWGYKYLDNMVFYDYSWVTDTGPVRAIRYF